MKKINKTKFLSLMLLSILLFWNVFPAVSLAGSFITPGTPIKPGQAISPGDPISGGDFLIPGDVYQPGDAIVPGDSYNDGKNISSGTPILENFPLTNGTFIIPNAPPLPPNFVFVGDSFTPGDPISPGDPSGAGETSSGNVDGNGKAIEGGDPGGNGNAIKGGDPNGDGKAIEGGNPDGNGKTVEGGDPSGNVNVIEGGDPDGSGNGIEGGEPGGNGNASEGKTGEGNPPLINTFFSTTDTSRGPFGIITGALNDYKKYGLDFFDKISQAAAAGYAGFKFNELQSGKYSVSGKNKLNNKVADWFYQRYKNYTYNGDDAHFGPNSRHIGKGRFNSFFESHSMGGGAGFWGNTKNAVVKSLNESWNPASKSFWKLSNSLKLGGPVNAVLSSVNSIYDYGFGNDAAKRSKGLASTDFAASLTTDVAIGVGSTAIGSVASSMAAGAVAGSAFPIVGTLVGAGVGLAVGVGTNLLINNTGVGRRLKAGTTKVIKNVYDGGVKVAKKGYSMAKKGVKAVSDGVSSAFKGIGGLFD